MARTLPNRDYTLGDSELNRPESNSMAIGPPGYQPPKIVSRAAALDTVATINLALLRPSLPSQCYLFDGGAAFTSAARSAVGGELV